MVKLKKYLQVLKEQDKSPYGSEFKANPYSPVKTEVPKTKPNLPSRSPATAAPVTEEKEEEKCEPGFQW